SDLEYEENGQTTEEKLCNLTSLAHMERATTNGADRDPSIVVSIVLSLKAAMPGQSGELTEAAWPVTISMNARSVSITFEYDIKDDTVYFKGEIDILEDFMAETAFNALHKACAVLHLDKTWTDVAIEVSVKM